MKCADAVARLQTAQDQFALRYYEWSMTQAEQELARGLVNVQRVSSSTVFLFLDFIGNCSASEARSLVMGNVKRFNSRGLQLAGHSVTSQESSIQSKFKGYFREEVLVGGQKLISARVPSREMEIHERHRLGQDSLIIKKTELKKLLKQSLAPQLGKPEAIAGSGLRYCQSFGPWYLITSLDLSGTAQLYYSQILSARSVVDSCPTYLQGGISPLSWWGIQPETAFDLIQQSGLPAVAEFVREMVHHFAVSLPPLLVGLEHGIPAALEDC